MHGNNSLPEKCHSIAKSLLNVSIKDIVGNVSDSSFHPFDVNSVFSSVKVEMHEVVFAWRDFPEKLACIVGPKILPDFLSISRTVPCSDPY